ncbi:hypothetical protein OEA41_007607 [Lepraria neglecta]|uniref:LIM zinc-binding domain-containing protein n=1 Tax=Lepraria neglecta TaxID=209136 RepID=A0AAD9ZFS9_9LECA|nr:hypothetical protein OEA41_007607 [Lepraria neglecta]
MTRSEQTGPHQATSNGPRRRSSGLKFFASSATPKVESTRDSQKTWEAKYLKNLRTNRPARPGGSRPLPGRASTSKLEPYARASSAMSFRPATSMRQPEQAAERGQDRCASAMSHRRAQSDMPTADANNGGSGRPIARAPEASVTSRDFSTSNMAFQAPSTTPDIAYRESGMRWMEKQEARSLREALEDMDVRDEAKVHAAAQDEASELVWKHRNQGVSGMPYRNPDSPYNYKQHLEKGAHARSQSVGWYGSSINGHVTGQRSVSDGSNSSKGERIPSSGSQLTSVTTAGPTDSNDESQGTSERGHVLWDSPEKKAYMGLAFTGSPTKKSSRRRSSAPRARDVSGGLFRNPDDKIYEEPDDIKSEPTVTKAEDSRIPAPLATKACNTASATKQTSVRSRVAFADEKQRVYRSEIHRNPPSQSHNPSYKKNERPSTSPDPFIANELPIDRPATKDGKEIRSDDIRAATSMRMRDRSPKLPSPTVVSDRPGRPIVSFDKNWAPKDTDKQEDSSLGRPSGVPARLRFKPHMPESTASAPIIPTINVPDPPSIHINDAPEIDSPSIPSISVSETPIPTISLPDEPPTGRLPPNAANRSRPSPANRPLPRHSSTTPVHSSKLHWSPSSRRATAQCAACALPIEGRIVSAASQRFHPHCFTCHHCAEALECVAFYPEPDSARTARLARIEARASGNDLDEKPGETAADDGDASLRFYCHLDFHELFSPRCRSCKTPIETEVVLACGGSWHVGHFFCAECGDPFDAKTPFVEKDGYAWCVGCHAGRFSGKCKGCRKPVVDEVVSALGAEWHVQCFCCVVSSHLLGGLGEC